MNKKLDRLAPITENGRRVPKWVRCYDDGGDSIDRYTVVYTNTKDGYCSGIAMSGAPFHPQGFGQHFEYSRADLIRNGQYHVDRPKYSHIGKPIAFLSLPADCQRIVLADYAERFSLPINELFAGLPGASITVASEF